MANRPTSEWEKSELYELLCLMATGTCLWIAGKQAGLFDLILRFVATHNLLDLFILMGCMSMGVFVAAVRKSLMLRNALNALLTTESRAATAARHDALTGLPNRRHFLEAFEDRLTARRPGEELAVVMIDLDRFKPVNDVHGHAAGNAVLCAVAERLRRIMPPRSVVARLGGDEFVALVPYEDDRQSLVALAEHVIKTVQTPIRWNQGFVDVSATIGIAVISPETRDAEAALHAADIAMYEGKREGRGRHCFFREEMERDLKARARLEADLRRAIAIGEIEPYFQPIVKLPSQDIVSFEVLARWRHPIRGSISPEIFIPVAEEMGVIADLFFSILDQATRHARNWPPHLRLALNLAPTQLRDPNLAERIRLTLARNGFAPSRIDIEITESSLIADLDAARATLSSLRDLGVHIALDDFGTGYSSLYHLKELRFDNIKIDRSYVTALKQDSEDARLVDAIIQIGASLSIETTAEGIETPSNLDWLTVQGCTFAQGYHFGRPMPKEAADRVVDAKTRLQVVDARRRAMLVA
jgi:diguanylate cyclase (GGDEF)-like protein